MKLNAVEVVSSDFAKTISFYTLLGFEFPQHQSEAEHIDSKEKEGSARLMIDSKEMITRVFGSEPFPGSHSTFALEFERPDDVDDVFNKVQQAGFTVITEPWNAAWGQRYAIVADPDGYKVDLYADL